MKNLISALTCSALVLICFHGSAQSTTKKYIKRNRTAPIITYGDSSIYSRGLYLDTGTVFFGNSDGSLYTHDFKRDTTALFLKLFGVSEIRDIAYSNGIMYAMQSGSSGVLAKINKKGPIGFQRANGWEHLFFDAIDINGDVGFLMADPVDGYFQLYHTQNGGKTWEPCEGKVPAIKDEGGFAASGTNVKVMDEHTYMFITGGERSMFHKSTDNGKTWTSVLLPYYPGKTTGAYSMCFKDKNHGVIVGGDYTQPELKMNTTYYTYNGGKTWYNSMFPPNGYRSCVYYANGIFYACGRNGIDFSRDDGATWTPFAEGTFFSMISYQNKLIATRRHGQFQIFDLVR